MKDSKIKNGEVSYLLYIQHVTRVNGSLRTWIGGITASMMSILEKCVSRVVRRVGSLGLKCVVKKLQPTMKKRSLPFFFVMKSSSLGGTHILHSRIPITTLPQKVYTFFAKSIQSCANPPKKKVTWTPKCGVHGGCFLCVIFRFHVKFQGSILNLVHFTESDVCLAWMIPLPFFEWWNAVPQICAEMGCLVNSCHISNIPFLRIRIPQTQRRGHPK